MKKQSRLTALLLALCMLMSTLPVSALADGILTLEDYLSAVKRVQQELSEPSIPVEEENAYTLTRTTATETIVRETVTGELSGEGESAFTLPLAGKLELSTAAAADAYQWQIDVGGVWANIVGDTAAAVTLTYAKVQNALSGGTARVRCAMTQDGQTVYSAVATVTVDETVKTQTVEGTEEISAVSYTSEAPRSLARTLNAGVGTYGAVPLDNTPPTYNVVINYAFENGTIVADPYTANLAAGSDFSATVTFPTVQGYLPYLNDNQQNSLELNYTAIDKGYTYNVVYKPTNVNYTVIHYQQNLNDDKYTEAERETKQGLTNSPVPEVAKDTKTNDKYKGFYALLYEKPEIAADGSTVVEVYYDRHYYLMNFDLDGGYGVEPIYARYRAPIGDVGTPTKAGYTFSGWTLNGSPVNELPATMPAENRTYKANWTANDTAKVTVVFWGENADDEEYSYIRSMQVDAKPGASYSYDGSTLTCPLAEHSHDTSKCTLNCIHVHTLDCYSTWYGFIETKKPTKVLTDNGNGIYTYTTGHLLSTTHYYLNIGDKWYCGKNSWNNKDDKQSISFDCEHTHTDACYSCGSTEHTHSSACSGLWTFVRSDTVIVAADGSSVVNVYYDRVEYSVKFYSYSAVEYTQLRITAKWGANISDKWPTYNKSNTWSVANGGSTYQVNMQTMPVGGDEFYGPKTGDGSESAHYYVEILPGEDYTETYKGLQYKWHHTDTSPGTGYTVTNDDKYELTGFEFVGYTTDEYNSYDEAKFFYNRKSFTLEFNDGYKTVKTESVKYETPLSTYQDFIPTVPEEYEAGSVYFGGWYLNPECTGKEYKLDEHTMPADNVLLYAKWVPVTHTVKFYLNKDAYDAGAELSTHPDITVQHGSKADPTPENPSNGGYDFVGWFYMDNDVEKAFDFANMPVNKDLKVYGKWSSNVLKEYTIYYKIQDTDTQIAAPTTGSGLAGVTKTFEAKGGTELYADYQEGYFPVTKSHSVTIDINATEENDTNVYTFWYVQKDAVPYTVKYLNKETGEPVATEKTDNYNRKAVVTETFVPVNGMMPDAYQKRLVVSVDENGNPDTEHNVIIFYYTKDDKHAYYKITHYTENLADAQGNKTWTEYASSQAVGDIGTTYTADPMTIPGFTYDSTVSGTVTSGKLTADGLELKLYYKRNSYPYQVRYLEKDTGKQLADPKDGTGKYGKVISESAIDITNYTPVDPTSQTLNIRIETDNVVKLNIITFYYKEKEVTINYEVVGPEGCGTVSPTSETLKVLTGKAQGSTASVTSDEYRFVGWYTDAACTTPVDPSWVDANNKLKLKPVKAEGSAWTAVTYYAKFEYNLTTLTVTKTGLTDSNESAIFTLTKKDDTTVIARFSLKNEQSVTIDGLTVGETYTVTEESGWTWHYDPLGSADVTIQAPPATNTVTFNNNPKTDKWLYAESSKHNELGGGEQ